MLKSAWNAVMNPEKNSLARFPKIVRFQLMTVLAFLWSAIFCVNAGLLVWLPGYVLIHVALILVGVFGTGWIFRQPRA
jgi:hypothetical protein